jgi:hypothetical protein
MIECVGVCRLYCITVLGKNEIEIRQLFIEMESAARTPQTNISTTQRKYLDTLQEEPSRPYQH